MENTLITIGIPVYNVEKYIKECIESVINQTYNNIEIIIVDDCGTDNSMVILNDTIKKSKRKPCIRIITQSQNLGVGVARNTIINEAKGEYIYFIDSDDVITTDCIDTLYKKICQDKYNFIIGSCAIKNEGLKNSIKNVIYKKNDFVNRQELMSLKYNNDYSLGTIVTAWNKLYNKHFLRDNHIEFLANSYYEDEYFFLYLMDKTKLCAFIPNITYIYRMRNNSIMHHNISTYSEKEIHDRNHVVNIEKRYIMKYKKDSLFRDIIAYYCSISFYYARGFYRNNINHLYIRPYIKGLLEFPKGFSIRIMIMNKNISTKIAFYWIISKLPYQIQCLILKYS